MFQILLTLSLVLFSQAADISISFPKSAQILRGKVEITGNLDVPNFSSAELDFSFASNPADNWFTIQSFSQPIKDSTLVTWDTTSLTDGDYNLRLRVFLQDGSFQEVLVSGVKIRNDVPLPTDTPTATEPPTPTNRPPTPTSRPDAVTTSFPSPTPMPINPASVTTTSIYSTLSKGGLVVLVLFLIFSLILRLRKN